MHLLHALLYIFKLPAEQVSSHANADATVFVFQLWCKSALQCSSIHPRHVWQTNTS